MAHHNQSSLRFALRRLRMFGCCPLLEPEEVKLFRLVRTLLGALLLSFATASTWASVYVYNGEPWWKNGAVTVWQPTMEAACEAEAQLRNYSFVRVTVSGQHTSGALYADCVLSPLWSPQTQITFVHTQTCGVPSPLLSGEFVGGSGCWRLESECPVDSAVDGYNRCQTTTYPDIDEDGTRCPSGHCKANAWYGNPIDPLRAIKRETVDTGLALGSWRLRFEYGTTSKIPVAGDAAGPADTTPRVLGPLWASTFHRRIVAQGDKDKLVARGDGRVIHFQTVDGKWKPSADVRDRLVANRYKDAATNTVEIYDSYGKLTSVQQASGGTLSFIYSTGASATAPAAGYLTKVNDNYGRSIEFRYELPSGAPAATGGRLSSIVDANGQVLTLGYNAGGMLASVTWADATQRQFLYELAALPWALTGVVDEKATRYATFGYDPDGRATSTQYVGTVNRYEVSHTTPPQIEVTEVNQPGRGLVRSHQWALPQGTTVVGPLGQVIEVTASKLNGKLLVASKTQVAGSGSAAAVMQIAYDANGNPTSDDDYRGNRTCYSYDASRNVQSVRVEGLLQSQDCGVLIPTGAALPAGGRKISTQWHPDWWLSTNVAEPGRITTYVYNGQPDPLNGNTVMAQCAPSTATLVDGKRIPVLCKLVEQATTDANGSQGFNAALQSGVTARVWQWTYDAIGKVLTETDPRNNATTNVHYTSTTANYTAGDLQRSTNAAGHVTQYPRYNKHGQVLQKIDANGIVTDYTYDLRQRLRTVTTLGQTTSYDYDAVGQLKKVTQPDGSFVAYDYDDAHRLIAVSDSQGNRIEYTLDNAGNRTAEQVRDPSGALKHQLARAMDALGRVQQTTGRE